MAAADAIASGVLGGATPFGWAQLGVGLLSGVAETSKPAGPSTAAGFFGSSQAPMDGSGWTLNFGDAASQTSKAGDRGGPTLNPTMSGAGAGGYATAAAPGGSASGGMSIPPVYLIGGALLLLLLWRRK